MAKSVFELTSKTTGKTIKLEAEYHAYMGRKIADADGIKVDVGPEIKITSEMVAYVNGTKYDTCRDKNFWRLTDIDKPMRGKKIWGLQIGFSQPEDAANYEKWVADLIEAGTDEDVKAFRAAEAEKELQRKIKMAKQTIEKAEKQDKIRTAKETREYLRNLNEVLNEGGEGWLPKLVTLEEYEEAKKFLAEIEKGE